ncbi:MAG: hypothetical protein GY835_08360 [bacterium]|nr:hypothetical protein [bacterium]
MKKINATTIAVALLIMALLPLCPYSAQARDDVDNGGFIYGVVTTESGKEYKGFLRWDDEEAFWDDLFHSSKEDLPYLDEYEDFYDDDDNDRDRRDRRDRKVKIFNWSINIDSHEWKGSDSRIFITRFGDIEKIQVTGSDDARIYMKSGAHFDVSGYANDVGGVIYVNDEDLGEINLHWNRIDEIRFMPAPDDADPNAFRLYGKVATRRGEFEGWIQWDKEECLSTDKLDGESEDGDIAIPMGRIESIERYGSRGCEVILGDGRTFRLRGTNDVNSDNRGIMVEDPRYGRVTIFWDEFERVDFEKRDNSGRSYRDFKGGDKLEGIVTDTDGRDYEGRIVFDLDEAWTWEILNGSLRDIEFDTPFMLVKSIEPRGFDDCKVELKSGETLRLEDSQDVSENNDGVLIFTDRNGDPEYVSWNDIEKITFK